MSEITKLYENAEVKKQIPKICSSNELYCKECKAHIEDAMPYCKNAKYPPFTAEKQLELVKWLAQNKGISINYDDRYFEWGMATDFYGGHFFDNFDECLADLVNVIWKDLTSEEKQQVKGILE